MKHTRYILIVSQVYKGSIFKVRTLHRNGAVSAEMDNGSIGLWYRHEYVLLPPGFAARWEAV